MSHEAEVRNYLKSKVKLGNLKAAEGEVNLLQLAWV
jgi:hypothetical protein